MSIKQLSPEDCEALLKTLEARFNENMNRHVGLKWAYSRDKCKNR